MVKFGKYGRSAVWCCMAAMCLALLFVFAGCSKESGTAGGQTDPQQDVQKDTAAQIDTTPVTLSLYTQMSDKDFAAKIADQIHSKYPFITMKLVPFPPNKLAAQLPGFVASGEVPDIIRMPNGSFNEVKQLDLFSDLTPLIKKYNFDLNRLDPGAVGEIKAYSGSDGMLFLPYSLQSAAIFYNKDLLDKFGVSYPKDGMAWQDATEMAKKLNRSDGGRTYRGLDFDFGFMMNNNQLSLPFVDPKTNHALINTDPWKHWVSTLAAVHLDQGSALTQELYNGGRDAFFKDQSLAMFNAGIGQLSNAIQSQKTGLNWDVVTMPTFPEAKNTGIMVNAPFYMITTSSKHKDQAFLAIAELMSDEVQKAAARAGELPSLTSASVKSEYGKDMPELQGRNIQAFFKLKLADPVVVTDYDKFVRTTVMQKEQDMIFNHKDINTALREAEEEANAQIQTQLQK